MIGTTSILSALTSVLGRPIPWTDVVVLRNFGGLRLDVPATTDAETRGFHARILDGRGRCTHYVKCRSPLNGQARREASVLVALRSTPKAMGLVPNAHIVSFPGLSALVLDMVEGPSFARRVAGAPLASAISEARACLAARQRLMTAAVEVGVVDHPSAAFDPLKALEPSLRILEERGVAPAVLRSVRATVDVGMPADPQHGDFTPANIIWSQSGPTVLDFEFFGLAANPLYDAWHFIRNSRVQRGDKQAWMGVVAPRDDIGAAWRSLLDEEAVRIRLSERQLRASLVWYLSHISAVIIARRNSAEYYRPYLDDLAHAVELVGLAP